MGIGGFGLVGCGMLRFYRISIGIKCIGISLIYWPPARRVYDLERITVLFAAILLVSRMECRRSAFGGMESFHHSNCERSELT
jgi:hypothetical protein